MECTCNANPNRAKFGKCLDDCLFKNLDMDIDMASNW